MLIGVEDTEPCGWRRLHCRILERSCPAMASFFTSNFIKSKSLTYSNASGLVGSSGPMARSALIVSLFFSKVFTNVAKPEFCLSSPSLRMQYSGWVSERDALERWSIKCHSKCSNRESKKTFWTNALQKTFASYGRTDLDSCSLWSLLAGLEKVKFLSRVPSPHLNSKHK